MTQADLSHSTLPRIQIKPLDTIARDRNVRNSRNILKQEPRRTSSSNNTLKFFEHFQAIPRGVAICAAEILTGRAADHTIEATRRDIERANIATPKNIRPTHNREAFSFKAAAKQINARKD